MKEYKKQMLDALESADKNRREHLETALDDTKTTRQRLAAFEKAGSIDDEELVRQALEMVEDRSVNHKLRAAALKKVAHHMGKDESRLDRLTQMITDKQLPDSLREAALQGLQGNSFSSPTFLARRPTYMGALRALVDDENPALRNRAIEYLAMNKDEYVQRRLIEGLENPKKKLTKPELAVQFLAYDLHADHFPILRKLAAKPPNKKTRMEALRNLAADAGSKELLRETLSDNDEAPEVRHLCAVALQRLDPAGFEESSEQIIHSEDENMDLKVALVNTRMHTPGTDVQKLATEFKGIIEEAKGGAKTRGNQLLGLMTDKTD